MVLKPNCILLFFAGFLVSLLSETMLGRTLLASHHKPQIAFGSTRDGNPEIYVMDADGNNQIRLTNHPETDLAPSWSSDGVRIAFSSNRNGGNYQIYVMDSNGKNIRRLTDGDDDWSPAWSPDGKRIAFHSKRDEERAKIFVVAPDGSNLRRLAGDIPSSDIEAAWSPDSQRIAFASYRGDRSAEIYVMDADGANHQRLTHDEATDREPAWSVVDADGSKKLWRFKVRELDVSDIPGRNDTAIHLMTADGVHLKRLGKEGDYSPDWFDPAALAVFPASNQLTIWGKLKKSESNPR